MTAVVPLDLRWWSPRALVVVAFGPPPRARPKENRRNGCRQPSDAPRPNEVAVGLGPRPSRGPANLVGDHRSARIFETLPANWREQEGENVGRGIVELRFANDLRRSAQFDTWFVGRRRPPRCNGPPRRRERSRGLASPAASGGIAIFRPRARPTEEDLRRAPRCAGPFGAEPPQDRRNNLPPAQNPA